MQSGLQAAANGVIEQVQIHRACGMTDVDDRNL
jgi:hypothetical protein